MRTSTLPFLLCLLLAAPVRGQDLVATVDGIELHASFWQNLHLTLYAAARAGLPPDPGLPRISGLETEPLKGDLDPAEQRAWNAAVAFYREGWLAGTSGRAGA